MDDIVIVSAARTPVGSFNGALGHAVRRTSLAPSRCRPPSSAPASMPADVDEVILGQVLAAGEGQNPARQAARAAGMPDAKTAFGINQVCGSGLRAVALGRAADPHRRKRHRRRRRHGEHEPVAARRLSARRPEDGRRRVHRHDAEGRAVGRVPRLPHGQHGGERRHQVPDHAASSRTQFALASQQKASAAQKSGRFKDEIAPVTVKTRKGDVVVSRRRVYPPRRQHGDDGAGCGRRSARTAR